MQIHAIRSNYVQKPSFGGPLNPSMETALTPEERPETKTAGYLRPFNPSMDTSPLPQRSKVTTADRVDELTTCAPALDKIEFQNHVILENQEVIDDKLNDLLANVNTLLRRSSY